MIEFNSQMKAAARRDMDDRRARINDTRAAMAEDKSYREYFAKLSRKPRATDG